MADAGNTWQELNKGSLKAASMEHGLQTTAIYWESQLNSHSGIFGQATYGQKWSWKLVDDQIRSFWGQDANDVAKSPYVFYGDRGYFRQYYGDKDLYDIVPAKKKFNFPHNNNLPFFVVSAADGTNVVRVVKEAIKLAIKNKEEPADEVMAEIWNLLRAEDSSRGRDAPDFDDELVAMSPTHRCALMALGSQGASPVTCTTLPAAAG